MEGNEDLAHYSDICNLSRNEVKRIVKEKRITRLLEQVKQELDKAIEEYKQVSEVAERLASVL